MRDKLLVAGVVGFLSVVPQAYAPLGPITFAVSGLAASADGTKLVMVGSKSPWQNWIWSLAPIYLSTNSGATWNAANSPGNIWQAVAASADATKLVAAATFFQATLSVVGDGLIYTSGDSGTNWKATSAPSNQWASVASSADGTRLVAAASSGAIYSSRDSGATWLQTSAPSNGWASIACSANGFRLVAAGQQLYTSTDAGTSWILTSAPTNAWTAVASSADGTRLLAAAGSSGTGLIYVSHDSGASWMTTTAPSNNWVSLAASAEGTRLVAATDNGIFTSADSGITWTAVPASVLPDVIWWTAVASSADGGRVAMAGNSIDVFTPAYPNPNAPAAFFTVPYSGPWRLAELPGNSWDSIVSSSDGSRLFASASGVVYSSSDSGATWVALTNAPGNVMAASKSGTTLVAAVSGGPVYISSDAGASWVPTSAPTNDWVSVACSSDATKLVAATASGFLLSSTNAGATWGAPFGGGLEWGSVASSADGTRFVAAGFLDFAGDGAVDANIFVSTNSGASWNVTSAPGNGWASVAMSADGIHLVAVAAGYLAGVGFWFPDGLIYISHDAGMTWTNAPAPMNDWTSVAMSSDGAVVAAGSLIGGVYISTDYGTTWAVAPAPFAAWKILTCSADASQIAAAGNGVVAILHPPAPALPLPPLPRLMIGQLGKDASLSWLVPSTRFVLQENASLTSSGWVDVTNEPTLNLTNLNKELILAPTPGSRFFRLKQP